jgi:hypothetical protein
LSDHEKLEIFYKFEPLGGRKPSQVLASMLACWPAGLLAWNSDHHVPVPVPATAAGDSADVVWEAR